MPAQLTLRNPKGGRVLAERTYADGYRIDAVSGWLVVVDRNGSVIAAHAACPGLEGRIAEHAAAEATPHVCQGCDVPLSEGHHEPDCRFADAPVEEPLAHEAPAGETARAQIARLADWIMENVDGEPSQSQGAVDTAIRLLDAWQPATQTVWRREVEEQTARAEREHAMRLSSEQTNTHLREKLRAVEQQRNEQLGDAQGRIAHLTAERTRLARRVDELQGAPALPSFPRPVDDRVPHEPIDLRPVEEDPRRPHPDAWPDDAVLLTYRELRRLVALHLDRYHADDGAARAVLDGDVPLRVSEVLA